MIVRINHLYGGYPVQLREQVLVIRAIKPRVHAVRESILMCANSKLRWALHGPWVFFDDSRDGPVSRLRVELKHV